MAEKFDPTRAEDEYFARQEIEKRKKWAAENAAKMQAEEKEKLKQLHWMKCPKDGMDLTTVELHGVKIDSCATCGGTWLDAGELEQLTRPERADLVGKIFGVFR